jgi:hypothetical protein
MMQYARLALFVFGFLVATGVEAVRADEAFLCENGRIVKVPFGKLDEMKRTNACVAAYFGLKIDAAPPIETGAIRSTAPDPSHPVAPLVPKSSDTAPRDAARAEPQTPAPLRKASAEKLPPPRAAVGTDYRNVLLLNPEPGQPAIFRHER